jgi:hypothetical protein
MAKITSAHRAACADAETRLKSNPNVVSVGIGYKYKGGVRTDEIYIVVGVRKKLPRDQVPEEEFIAQSIGGVATDVIEYGDIRALVDVLDVGTQALTQRRRPCPPGYSVGHPLVTAGTLGAWVHRGPGEEHYILSNNHVIADSNDAVLGDFIRQPGRADGGTDDDRFARLTEYVRIRFDGENGNGNGGKKSSSSMGWKVWKWPANAIASLVGCPYRLVVARPNVIEQPEPNLVDAAVARVLLEDWVDLEIPGVGEIQGFRDLDLGDRVIKTGRSTETTKGLVETVSATSQVDYGVGKGTATFSDQFVIRGESGDFSQGGDSGSVVLDEEGFVGGLLFAGGSGVTIVNRMSHVVSLLGIRV